MLVASSCNSKKETMNNLLGSTLENINNSEHSVVQFQVDGKLCFATVNQFFKDYDRKSDFPLSLWITVETKDKNEQGHPVDKEAELFNNLEDSLISALDGKTPYCYIGRTTRDGYRELMFYVSDKDKATEIVRTFIETNKFNRQMDFLIDWDREWESVSGLYM